MMMLLVGRFPIPLTHCFCESSVLYTGNSRVQGRQHDREIGSNSSIVRCSSYLRVSLPDKPRGRRSVCRYGGSDDRNGTEKSGVREDREPS